MPPKRVRELILGQALDPLKRDARQSLALVAFIAWIGLGANGLSSVAYGPQEAFKALGSHTHLGLYLALATGLGVMLIAIAYNQIIELFPSGGGGYRAATSMIGPYAGLAAGAALVVDFVLTIAISVAAGTDALFSLLPLNLHSFKITVELLITGLLIFVNLRGSRESAKLLVPIFLGFAVTHAILIVYGLLSYPSGLANLVPVSLAETSGLAAETGWLFVLALFLRAFALGGGTYTGIEVVSNSVDALAEPRVRTAKLAMLYTACSMAIAGAGIILLYMIWSAAPIEGYTMNAVVFESILHNMGFAGSQLMLALGVVMALQFALLLIAANSGFQGGPAVLANMAIDSWVPHKFRYLSSRLVTQNGIVLMGIAGLAVLLWSGGQVELLVVLYSINVFLTFSLTLAGLCIYWYRNRRQPRWKRRLLLSAFGLALASTVLVVTIAARFANGGLIAIVITGLFIALCIAIRAHYRDTKQKIRAVDTIFANQPYGSETQFPELDPELPTAVFVVGTSRGGGLHALLWVQRMFPEHFKNFIFVNARTVDSQAYGADESIDIMRTDATVSLNFFVNFCHSHGMAAKSYLAFGIDAINEVDSLCQQVHAEFPNAIFFISKLITEKDNFLTRVLHNQAATALQRRLHLNGMQMVILPMKV